MAARPLEYDQNMKRPAQGGSERPTSDAAHRAFEGMRGAIDARELFWNNVIRDILMSLSVMKLQHDEAIRLAKDEAAVRAQTAVDQSGATITGPLGADGARSVIIGAADHELEDEEAEGDETDDEARISASEDRIEAQAEEEGIHLSGVPPFDGRMAVITQLGVRIAIADVYPLFACSVGETSLERALSEDVQCSVFQIRRPQGEVHTLPVHEIRSFHSLSEQLMRQIAAASSREDQSGVKTTVPFGFGAYTSLAKSATTAERPGT